MKITTGFIITALAWFASFFCLTHIEARASDKDKILSICNRFFGKSIDERQTLFEVNHFYVLRLKFDERNNVEELAVEPKYYFEESHPGWKETDNFEYLSKAEYEKLLAKVDAIKRKGKLVKPAAAISYVTNMTAWRTEIYEKASLTWGELIDIQRGENAPYEVKWFRLSFGTRRER
jgi:hypothetical protein